MAQIEEAMEVQQTHEQTKYMHEETDYFSLEGKKTLLISALKKTYEDLYKRICPIPYMREKTLPVNEVFIDSGIERNESSTPEKLPSESWQPLESYNAIFERNHFESSRIFLLGSPGFGKSTLTLKLAYDWCNEVDGSVMKNVDILILLRLRQFSGKTSISKAIKLFLVKKQNISVEEITAILRQYSSSITIIFDGYDEYLEDNDKGIRPVDKVLQRKELANIDVVITTRYLPKKLPTESQVLRLKGFGTDAREQFMKKTLINDEKDELKSFLKDELEINTVLRDLCKVPLLFAMFVHVADEKQTDLGDFTSLTDIFRFLISCFHDHFRNKLRDVNVNNVYRFEHDHSALDKIAFEALSRYQSSVIWSKEYVAEQLSQKCYDRYKTLGIFLEEETVCDDLDVTIKVRFYHNIICEWYAAHYLSFLASKTETTFTKEGKETHTTFLDNRIDTLSALPDPSKFPYVYRFACGLRLEAVKPIKKYLMKIEGGEMFATICLMEQASLSKKSIEGIKNFCGTTISLRNYNTKLSRRSLVQMLNIASTEEFCVHCLSVDSRMVKVVNDRLFIGNEYQLPKLQVKNVKIDVVATKMPAKDIVAVSGYAQNSKILESIDVHINTEPICFPGNDILLNENFVRLAYNNRRYEPDIDRKCWKITQTGEKSRKRKTSNAECQTLPKQTKKEDINSDSDIPCSRIPDNEGTNKRQKTGESSKSNNKSLAERFCSIL